MHTLNAPNNIAKVTNQWGAIPISLLNSHFHSSIGTSHSKTCITLPPLPGTAQHDNQVKTFSPHFLSHIEPGDQSQTLRTRTQTHSLMSQTSWDEGLCEFIVAANTAKIHFMFYVVTTNLTSSRRTKVKPHTGKCTHTEIFNIHSPWCTHTPTLVWPFLTSVIHFECSLHSELVALTFVQVKALTQKLHCGNQQLV